MPSLNIFALDPLPHRSLEPSTSARKFHIRRLNDILHLCIQRNDLVRAKKAWAILARCDEVDWMTIWKTGLAVAGDVGPLTELETRSIDPGRSEYLKILMMRRKHEREEVLQEIILTMIASEKYREALDELELYLPSFPFQDNPVLHTYAGLISLYLAYGHPNQQNQSQFASQSQSQSFLSTASLRAAKAHFERARALDGENVVAMEFLEQISSFISSRVAVSQHLPNDEPSDEEGTIGGSDFQNDLEIDSEETSRPRKRAHLS